MLVGIGGNAVEFEIAVPAAGAGGKSDKEAKVTEGSEAELG